MTTRLEKDPRLIKSLVPDFPVGCRRSTPGNGYLEALVAENVGVVTDKISHITPSGMVLATGEHVEFDVLICATGFDLSFRPRFPVIGHGGISLQEQWTTGTPEAYMSLAVENFPNYFGMLLACSMFLFAMLKTLPLSLPWTECAYWAWLRAPNCRTCHQVHDQHDEENPNARYQISGTET